MRQRLKDLHSNEEGQVLWLFAMSILALVILAALVVNTGRQAARKIEMQNAADTAAVSGAMWMARGMNIISMDNVGMTETLGLIANLRAMHLAWQTNEIILEAEYLLSQVLEAFVFTAPAGIALEIAVWIGWAPTCAVEAIDISSCWVPPDPPDFSAPGDGRYEDFAHPTDGYLWKFMDVLQGLSDAATYAAPAMAFFETYNIGSQNISHPGGNETPFAVMLPNFGTGQLISLAADTGGTGAGSSGGYGLPVEEGDFNELCDPAHNGTDNGSPVDTRGYTPFLGYSFGVGPFQKYRDDFNKIWYPSAISGMPFGLYSSIAETSFAAICGGAPTVPNIDKKITDLNQARAAGATSFTWTYSSVKTIPTSSPLSAISFVPTNSSQAQQQLNTLNSAGSSLTTQQLQNLQNSTVAAPTFNTPVDGSSFSGNYNGQTSPVTQPSNFSDSLGPACNPVQHLGSWCQTGNWTWERITQSGCVSSCTSNNPQQPATPQYIYTDERWIFDYATVSQPVDTSSLYGNSGDGYPQPAHFTLGNGKLQQSDLGLAIQRLQFLTLAYRSQTAAPWIGGAKVSVNGTYQQVFGNPNSLGILTYAQSQVYNPTSWDMYTQNWHAKLVPASMLESTGGTANSAGISSVLNALGSLGSTLNAH